jgi:hypothetical protein
MPLAAALAPVLGTDARVLAAGMRANPLHDLAGPNRKVLSVRLAAGRAYLERDKQAAERIIAAHFPVAAPRIEWQAGGRRPVLAVFTAHAPPPDLLPLGQVPARLLDLPPGRYLLGLGGGNRPAILDTSAENPHLAVNARSRKGKTNLLSCVIAQGLRRGEEFWCCDPKEVSLRHFLGLDGFVLASDPDNPGQMAALVLAFAEAMRAARRAGDASRHRTLVIEEINSFSALISRWHGGLTKDNPVVQAILDVLHMGPQFSHRVLLTGQNLTQDAMWGSRHQFGNVLLTGYAPAQWRFITGDSTAPPEPAVKGRMYWVRDGAYSQVQVPVCDPRPGHNLGNDLGWRQYALAGRVTGGWEAQPTGEDQPGWPCLAALRPGHDPLAGPAIPAASPPGSDVCIGWRQAANYLGMSVAAFVKARQRHRVPGEWTEKIGPNLTPCWTKASLDGWADGSFRQRPGKADGQDRRAGQEARR